MNAASDANRDRAERIMRILEEVAARRMAGEAVPDDTITALHADLLPELAEELRELQRVEDARFRAHADACPDTVAVDVAPGGIAFRDDAFPGYTIIRELHRGGQGVVYQAIQHSTKRKVALKVMHDGPKGESASRRRFEREVELVSGLRHPNIVPIFDRGVSHGRFYYTMEYIRGTSLSQFVHERRLLHIDTLHLFCKVCEAVAYAHQKGVIHRDLKPTNILVDERGEPHILDFGLAKTGVAQIVGGSPSAVMSVTGEIIGTLAYMSPEQASGQPDQVDMRSDVYALGVILYELVTGEHPYNVSSPMVDVLRNITEVEPKRPSRTVHQIDGDVETIILKALSKDRHRRYDSAAALGRDIGHFLDGDPIEARCDSALYLLKKSIQRYRVPVVIVASFIALLIASSVLSWSLYGSARRARDVARAAETREAEQRRRAERERVAAVRLSAELALDRGLALCEQDAVAQGMIWLARSLQLTPPDYPELQRVARMNVAAWNGKLHSLVRILAHTDAIECVAFVPDGQAVLTGSGNSHTVRRWDVRTGQPVGEFTGEAAWVTDVAANFGATQIIAGGSEGGAWVWDARGRRSALRLNGESGWVKAVAFPSSVGMALTASADGSVRLWTTSTGEVVRVFTCGGERVETISFRPDGEAAVTGGEDGIARIWDLSSDTVLHVLEGHDAAILSAAFSPDGRWVATGGRDGTAQLWHAHSGQRHGRPLRHRGEVFAVAFSVDGKTLLTGCADNTVHLWNVRTSEPIGAPARHFGGVADVAFSPTNPDTFVSGSSDNTARVWQAAVDREPRIVLSHDDEVWGVAFSPDGATILTGCGESAGGIWHATTGTRIGQPLQPGWIAEVAFSPDGHRMMLSEHVWDVSKRLPIGDPLEHAGGVIAVAYSADGRYMATGSIDNTAQVWDATTLRPVSPPLRHNGRVESVAFHPQRPIVLTGSWDNSARLWHAETGQLIGRAMSHHGPVRSVAFSPDGARLITGSGDTTAQIWDATALTRIAAQLPHDDGVGAVLYSPDGRLIVTGCDNGFARFWDPRTQKPIGPPLRHGGPIHSIAFRPEGSEIITGSGDRKARVWPIPPTARTQSIEEIVLTAEVATGLEIRDGSTINALGADTWERRREKLHALKGTQDP